MNDKQEHNRKLAVLTNLVAPYRVPILARIGRRFRLSVLISGHEPNRGMWQDVMQYATGVEIQSVGGSIIRVHTKQAGEVFDHRWIHLHPGYLWHLFRDRPDGVITSEMGFRTLCGLLYGTVMRKPVWVWWGGTMHTEQKPGLLRRAIRWIVSRWARRWISYGRAATEYLKHLGVPENHILQIQNSVDEETFTGETEAKYHFAPRPVLMFVGQLIRRKGVRYLIESAARLQMRGHEFSLVLVGDGPEKDALQILVEKLGVRNVHFVPPHKPEQMASVYRSANCLVFPTLEDVWGLVVNEAMWCGVPTICSTYAGCAREIVPPDNQFDPLDAEDFDRMLLRAINGTVAGPDTSCLKTSDEVADMIIGDVNRVIASTQYRNAA